MRKSVRFSYTLGLVQLFALQERLLEQQEPRLTSLICKKLTAVQTLRSARPLFPLETPSSGDGLHYRQGLWREDKKGVGRSTLLDPFTSPALFVRRCPGTGPTRWRILPSLGCSGRWEGARVALRGWGCAEEECSRGRPGASSGVPLRRRRRSVGRSGEFLAGAPGRPGRGHPAASQRGS